MPRITEEQRQARRHQILDAARACVIEYGLEAVSMEMIVSRSGLSTGAVYRYFKGKDEIIGATVREARDLIAENVARALEAPAEIARPAPLIERLLLSWIHSSHSGTGAAREIDLTPVAVHGWSYVQTNPELKSFVQASVNELRGSLVPVIKRWQVEGLVGADADPEAVAQLITSICLGFVAQRSLSDDTAVQAHVDAVIALTTPDVQRSAAVAKSVAGAV
jgi:AcrR family transcriptional regulator